MLPVCAMGPAHTAQGPATTVARVITTGIVALSRRGANLLLTSVIVPKWELAEFLSWGRFQESIDSLLHYSSCPPVSFSRDADDLGGVS